MLVEPRSHGALGETPERHELATGTNRLGDRAELVGDEHDRGVERRLLEILQQCVGRIVVEQVGREQEVDPIVGLERAQVEIVVQLADGVDPDHVSERLDHAQIGVGSVDDPAGVAELHACECERGRGLADPRRPVEEIRVSVPIPESGCQQALGLGLLRHRGKRIIGGPAHHRPIVGDWKAAHHRRASTAAAIRSARSWAGSVPSSTRYRSGKRAASCR